MLINDLLLQICLTLSSTIADYNETLEQNNSTKTRYNTAFTKYHNSLFTLETF